MRKSMIIAKVAKIYDKYRLVINKGLEDGVEKGMDFYVYEEGEDVTDPDTGEVLQKEEFVKAWLKVIHSQEKIAILESAETEKVVVNNPLSSSFIDNLKYYIRDSQLPVTREVMKPLNIEKTHIDKVDESGEKIKINDKRMPIRLGDLVKHIDKE
jgi:hypothetical protein